MEVYECQKCDNYAKKENSVPQTSSSITCTSIVQPLLCIQKRMVLFKQGNDRKSVQLNLKLWLYYDFNRNLKLPGRKFLYIVRRQLIAVVQIDIV